MMSALPRVLATAAILACSADAPTAPPAELWPAALQLAEGPIQIDVGDTIPLARTGEGKGNAQIQYTSSNSSVLSIEPGPAAVGRGTGSAYLHAKERNHRDSLLIQVSSAAPPPPEPPPPPPAEPPPPPPPEPPPPSDPPPTTPPLVGECKSARVEWIWCDDFDVDRLASYFEYSSGSGRFVRVSDAGIGGSGAMRTRFSAGTVSAGSIKVAFGKTPASYFRTVDAGTKNYREIYYRHFVYFPAGWQGGIGHKVSRATSMATSGWAQSMIAHIWSGSNDLYMDPASGTDDSGKLMTTKYNDFDNLRWLGRRKGPTPIATQTGLWHCIETRVKLNEAGKSNGVFQFWVNDKLEASRTDLNWVGSYDAYGINAVFLENYWNDGAPRAQDRFFDNFVVSTARIGCGQ